MTPQRSRFGNTITATNTTTTTASLSFLGVASLLLVVVAPHPATAFLPRASTTTRTFCHTNMASNGLIDAANFAVSQAPATTKFVTNKMCPFGAYILYIREYYCIVT